MRLGLVIIAMNLQKRNSIILPLVRFLMKNFRGEDGGFRDDYATFWLGFGNCLFDLSFAREKVKHDI